MGERVSGEVSTCRSTSQYRAHEELVAASGARNVYEAVFEVATLAKALELAADEAREFGARLGELVEDGQMAFELVRTRRFKLWGALSCSDQRGRWLSSGPSVAAIAAVAWVMSTSGQEVET